MRLVIANSALRASLAISYPTRAHGIIVKYIETKYFEQELIQRRYRISSNKRRPQINAAPESQNINKRRPGINAAPLGAAFIRIFNKTLVYLKGS